jgi:PTH1 family peptidyl-tRNA hydrolase
LRTFGSAEVPSAGRTGRFKMIVGLGNPGRKYARTRHNAGFLVVDLIAELLGIELRQKKFGAVFGYGEFEGKKLMLLKPQKFMNRSGQVVTSAAGYYRLKPEDILVVSDDMALEPGRIRIRAKGSAGGHKGLEDITQRLKSSEFARLRIGIGKSDTQPWEDYVLAEPRDEEKESVKKGLSCARQAALCWLTRGVEAAMNGFNG